MNLNENSKVKQIWNQRYSTGGNSGSGSYGVLCEYKSYFINKFVNENSISNIIEFGSGDGNNMKMILYSSIFNKRYKEFI